MLAILLKTPLYNYTVPNHGFANIPQNFFSATLLRISILIDIQRIMSVSNQQRTGKEWGIDMRILETERMTFREMTHEDIDAICEIVQDEEAMRFRPGAMTQAEAEENVGKQLQCYREDGFGRTSSPFAGARDDMSKLHDDKAALFKAFSDSSRLMILELLRGGEMCANDLLKKLPIAQSTLSYHMKLLVEAGAVQSRKEGRTTYYRISAKGCEAAIGSIRGVTGTDAPTSGKGAVRK
jgi:ArsR family transcriptional regulator